MLFTSLKGIQRLLPPVYCPQRCKLSETAQTVYDLMVKAIAEKKKSVHLHKLPPEDLQTVLEAIISDQPMLYYLGLKGIEVITIGPIISLRWEFWLDEHEIEQYDICLLEKLREIRRSLPYNDTLLARERELHDLLLNMGIQPMHDSSERIHHVILGPLLIKQTVCDGLAQLFRLLCVMYNIPCQTIVGEGIRDGESESHRWNLVRLGNCHVHVDVYWDLNLRCTCGYNGYDYFNLSDASICVDHHWDRTTFPPCETDRFSWFVTEKCEVKDLNEFRRHAESCRDRGEKIIRARIGRQLDSSDCIDVAMQVCCGRQGGQLSVCYNEQIRALSIMVMPLT